MGMKNGAAQGRDACVYLSSHVSTKLGQSLITLPFLKCLRKGLRIVLMK